MKSLLFAALAVLPATSTPVPAPNGPEIAMMCFKSGERVSGMNKICYYNCGGSEAAITIGAVELCPLSINN